MGETERVAELIREQSDELAEQIVELNELLA